MHAKTLLQSGAIFFVCVAIGVTVIELTRDEPELPLYRTLAPPTDIAADPFRAALRQCRDMGEAAIQDAGCRKLWMQARDRFLGRQHAPAAPEGR